MSKDRSLGDIIEDLIDAKAQEANDRISLLEVKCSRIEEKCNWISMQNDGIQEIINVLCKEIAEIKDSK